MVQAKMFKCSLKYLLLLFVFCKVVLTEDFDSINSYKIFTNKLNETILLNQKDVSQGCNVQIKEYVKGLILKEKWALQMFDAAAKPPSGILEGNIIELGSFDECLNIEKIYTNKQNIYGKYCLPTISINLNPKVKYPQSERNFLSVFGSPKPEVAVSSGKINFRMGTCLPNACSANDIQQIYKKIGFNITLNENLCQTLIAQPKLDHGAIATLSFFGIVLWVMAASTIYDAIMVYLEKRPHHPMLIAFSVLTNGKKLLATSNSPNQISCLHGIRVISTLWVILGHRYVIQAGYPTKYYLYMDKWLKNPANMFILGATVSVDTFFLMAGLVISYLYMKSKNKFNIILYYVHRYLRLTPALAIVMLIHVTLLKYMGSGPLWPFTIKSALIDGCNKNWWKSLLYIQNYGNMEQCVPQGWYLAVDMQLFLLSPILLLPMKRWPGLTLLATGCLTILSILSSFLTAWFYELNGSFVSNTGPEKLRNYMKYYYMATWTRSGPWLMGIILGYFIFKVQRKTPIVMNKVVVLCTWAVSLAVLCTCVFAGHSLSTKNYNRLENSFYIALVRPAWSAALAWVIFACVTAHGGFVNWFLSLPLFQVVSKFTYTLYLVHYTTIHITTLQMRTPPILTNPRELYIFWGDFAFSFVIAVLLTLAFESPIITIEKCIFGQTKEKESKRLGNHQNAGKFTEVA